MKKVFLSAVILICLSSPSFAWYDGYGVYHCTYLDPVTSIFDSIFGQPCPQPVIVVERPVPVPQPYPVPEPYPVEVPVYVAPPPQLRPCPTYGYWCW